MGVSMKKSLRKRSAQAALFLLLLGLVPAFFTYITMIERGRRVHVLTEGLQIDAAVLRSDDSGPKNLCRVDYSFELSGANYAGGAVSCPLMHRHPTGSRIPIRVDPTDPEGSLAVGETVWPGYAVAPVLLWPPWLLVAGLALFSTARDARSGRKRTRPTAS